VLDDSNAPDTDIDKDMVPVFRSEIAGSGDHGVPAWLVMHRPIWAAIKGPLGMPIGGNKTLIKAIGRSGIPKAVELMLAGHIHTFEAINYKAKAPPQIVAGNGGDNLDITPLSLKHAIFQGFSGVHVRDGISVGGFGFMMMTRAAAGWSIQLYNQDGTPGIRCGFAGGRVDCPTPER
jgi:hypothetical protein